jgi:hypothetical protein
MTEMKMIVLSPLARRLLVIGLVLVAFWLYSSTRPAYQPDGIIAADAPVEEVLTRDPPMFERNAHRLTATARFSGKLRLIGVQRYSLDRAAQVSPLDAAVGWARLSDSAVLRTMELAQSGREFVYQAYDPALADTEVRGSALNLHLVPATPELATRMKDLRAGQLVTIAGYVVEVAAADGWRLLGTIGEPKRSLPSRVVWVEQLDLH